MELKLDQDGLNPKNAATRASRTQDDFVKKRRCQSSPVKPLDTGTISTPRPTGSRRRHRLAGWCREALDARHTPAAENLGPSAAAHGYTSAGIPD